MKSNTTEAVKPLYIANFDRVVKVKEDEENEEYDKPNTLPEYIAKLQMLLENLNCDYYKIAGALCVAHNDYKKKKTIRVKRIDNVTELFSFLGSLDVISQFKERNSFFTKAEAFSALRDKAKEKDFEASVPHEPKIRGVYYRQFEVIKSEGLIDRLARLWNPSTEHDIDFIKAAIATPFWGGPPGARPGIFIESDTGDKGDGRGYGKTALAQVTAELAGGMYSGCNISDIKAVRKRILNSSDMGRRIVLFDNIKKFSISSGELEDTLTSKDIGGADALYRGDASVLNYFTYFFTINGLTLSPDMTSRAFIIRIKKANHGLDYDRVVEEICVNKKQQAIFEIINMLKAERQKHSWHCRFRSWHEGVLERLTDSEGAKIIKARQNEANVSTNLSEDFADFLYDHLSTYHAPVRWSAEYLDPASNVIAISALAMANIAEQSQIFGKLGAVNHASKRISDLDIPNLVKHKRNGKRLWLWLPDSSIYEQDESGRCTLNWGGDFAQINEAKPKFSAHGVSLSMSKL